MEKSGVGQKAKDDARFDDLIRRTLKHETEVYEPSADVWRRIERRLTIASSLIPVQFSAQRPAAGLQWINLWARNAHL